MIFLEMTGSQIDNNAFDSIPNRKRLHKLEQYDITGNINGLLRNVYHQQDYEEEKSEAVTANSGVP